MCATYDEVRAVVGNLIAKKRNLSVLEAGCGSFSYFPLPETAHVAGIDISEKQLARNSFVQEKICGDLQTYPLPADRYDTVVCWDVLEHLPEPEKALGNMIRATSEDGALVVAIPNLLSTKGLIAKLTPHWFHIFVYRVLLGRKDAGKDDKGPFPTFLRTSILPGRLLKTAKAYGLNVEFFRLYESPMQSGLRGRKRWVDLCLRSVAAVGKALSFGKVDLNCSDCLLVLRKPLKTSRAFVPAPAVGRAEPVLAGRVHLGP